MKQLDLFQWAETRPSSVVNAQGRFQDRAIAFVRQIMAANAMPPHTNGEVINPPQFRRERNVA